MVFFSFQIFSELLVAVIQRQQFLVACDDWADTAFLVLHVADRATGYCALQYTGFIHAQIEQYVSQKPRRHI